MVDLDFFSSPIGLGHVTRDIAIANNFENISTKFVTGSGAAKILKNLDLKVEDIYIPPQFIVENGMLKNSTRWLWNYYQYYKRCKKSAKKIIDVDSPRLVISDEDFASLTVAQNKKISFDKKTIIVSIGGTDAGLFLIEKTLESILKINQDVNVIVVSGPSLSKKFGDSIRNLGFVSNLHEIIFAADVIVSLAGKSTIDEAKAYGTPGIFIPIKGHFEQEDNAKEAGFVFEDINKLDKLILEKLEQKRSPLETKGAINAYNIIKKMI